MFKKYLKEMDLFISATRAKLLMENEENKKFKKIEAQDIIYAANRVEIKYSDSIQLSIRDIVSSFSENEIRNLILILEPLALTKETQYKEIENNVLYVYRDSFFIENDNSSLLTFERNYLIHLSSAFIVHYSTAAVDIRDSEREAEPDEDPTYMDFWEKKLRSTYNIKLQDFELVDAEKYIEKFESSENTTSYFSFLKKKIKLVSKDRLIQEREKRIEAIDEEIKKYEMDIVETTALIARLQASSDIKNEYIAEIVEARKDSPNFYEKYLTKFKNKRG